MVWKRFASQQQCAFCARCMTAEVCLILLHMVRWLKSGNRRQIPEPAPTASIASRIPRTLWWPGRPGSPRHLFARRCQPLLDSGQKHLSVHGLRKAKGARTMQTYAGDERAGPIGPVRDVATSLCPASARPRNRVILVLAPLSSTNTSWFTGSAANCSCQQALFGHVGRFCSLANRVFFIPRFASNALGRDYSREPRNFLPAHTFSSSGSQTGAELQGIQWLTRAASVFSCTHSLFIFCSALCASWMKGCSNEHCTLTQR